MYMNVQNTYCIVLENDEKWRPVCYSSFVQVIQYYWFEMGIKTYKHPGITAGDIKQLKTGF